MKKKWTRMLRKLANDRELSEHERFLFARSLSSTPDERWEAHTQFLRSYGLSRHSERRAFGFK